MRKCHPREGGRQGLSVHLTARPLQVVVLPLERVRTRLEGSHSEEVRHHGAEARSQARLGYETQLELGQANDVIAALPVPAGNVEQVGLVVVLHQLDDDPDVVRVVLDRDDAHDVGSVLRVGVLAVLVGEDQARVGLVDLNNKKK